MKETANEMDRAMILIRQETVGNILPLLNTARRQFRNNEFENGIEMLISGGYTNGIRYEGTEGWIFVSRGNYKATATDPESKAESAKALDASDRSILTSQIQDHEVKLYVSEDQHGNWLDCIKSRKAPISNAEVGHRVCTTCLISHIAMKLPRKLSWDAANERFREDDEANAMLSRTQRAPWGYENIDMG